MDPRLSDLPGILGLPQADIDVIRTGGPTVEELRQDLRAVLNKCRPDWDINTPELKTAWAEGRKELFYPYGKTFVETLAEQG